MTGNVGALRVVVWVTDLVFRGDRVVAVTGLVAMCAGLVLLGHGQLDRA